MRPGTRKPASIATNAITHDTRSSALAAPAARIPARIARMLGIAAIGASTSSQRSVGRSNMPHPPASSMSNQHRGLDHHREQRQRYEEENQRMHFSGGRAAGGGG